MSFLVRKIARSKWPSNDFEQMVKDEIPADALSNCMKTSKNTLSTWEIESLDNIEEAVLALVASGDHIDTIHVVYIERDNMESKGLNISDIEGKTPVKDLVDTHKDIAALTYQSVGEFANLILGELKQKKEKRYAKSDLVKIINKAIENGRLDPIELKEGIRSKLGA